jgi:hypothetical protein
MIPFFQADERVFNDEQPCVWAWCGQVASEQYRPVALLLKPNMNSHR